MVGKQGEILQSPEVKLLKMSDRLVVPCIVSPLLAIKSFSNSNLEQYNLDWDKHHAGGSNSAETCAAGLARERAITGLGLTTAGLIKSDCMLKREQPTPARIPGLFNQI